MQNHERENSTTPFLRSPIIRLPCPLQNFGLGIGKEGETELYTLSRVEHLLSDAVVHVCDPDRFIPKSIWHGIFKCPRLGCGKNLHRHGFAKRFRIGKSFDTHIVMYFPQTYLCDNCLAPKGDKQSSCFSALSPHLLVQMPECVRQRFPLVVSGRNVFSSGLVALVCSLVTKGTTFTAIAESMNTSLVATLMDKDVQRLDQLNRVSGHVSKPALPTDMHGYVIDFARLISPSARVLRDVFFAQFGEREALIHAQFLVALRRSKAFCIDQKVHKLKGAAVSGAMSLQVVMNTNGEMLCLKSCATKSTKAFKKTLTELRTEVGVGLEVDKTKRDAMLKRVYTDQPDEDKNVVAESCGSNVKCELDIFHLIERALKCTSKKSYLRNTFSTGLSLCIYGFERTSSDRKLAEVKALSPEARSQLLGKYRCKSAEDLCRCPLFLLDSDDILRVVKNPVDIAANLEELFQQFALTGLFLPGQNYANVLKNLKYDVLNYVSSSASTDGYSDSVCITDSRGKVRYRYTRGTNMVELFNRFVENLDLPRYEKALGNAVLLTSASSFSLENAEGFGLINCADGVSDLLRVNKLLEASSKVSHLVTMQPLGIEALIPVDRKDFKSGWKHDLVGSTVHRAFDSVSADSESPLTSALEEKLSKMNRVAKGFSSVTKEWKLLNSLAQDPNFADVKKSEKGKYYEADGKVKEAFWVALSEKAGILDSDEIAFVWCTLLSEARLHGKSSIAYSGSEFEIDGFTFKEPAHVRDGLRNLATGICRRLHPGAALLASQEQVTLVNLLAVNMPPKVTLERAKKGRKRERQAATTTVNVGESVAAAVTVTGKKLKATAGRNVACEWCPKAKHDGVSDTCPYICWKNAQVVHPPRISLNGKQESIHQAYRRCYRLHLLSHPAG